MASQMVKCGRSIAAKIFLILISCFVIANTAVADTVTVDAKAAGKFGTVEGSVDEVSLDLVKAYEFPGPGRITIVAKGRVNFHPEYPPFMGLTPKGKSFQRAIVCTLPLEEALVDSKGKDALGLLMKDAGALMGAFVAQSIVNTPGFRAINDDFTNVGISSDKLFLVGARFEFTAPEAGTLFLGVNDCRPSNNSGSFTVQISAG